MAEVRPLGLGVKSLVRLDQSQHQELLKTGEERWSNFDVSEDGAHAVFVNGETRQLEDVGGGEPPVVLSIMPGGTQSACGLAGDSFRGPTVSVGQARAGLLVGPGYQMMAVKDASRVYFEAPENGDCSGLFRLYVRNRDTGQTTLIDPGTVVAGERDEPEFVRATPDGRHAYFVTYSNHATYPTIDPEGKDTNSHADLYRWDEQTGTSTCVTCEANPDVSLLTQHVGQGDFRGLLISDDFSHVYFESTKRLAPGGIEGNINIYVLSGNTIRFVADPNQDGVLNQFLRGPQLSADGNVLVFATATDSRDVTTDVRSVEASCPNVAAAPGKCGEIYLYDDRDGSVECISCVHGGVTSRSGFGARLSSDGSTVAFVSGSRLVAGDVNGGSDVYEWRDGVVSLISDGVSSFPGGFIAPKVRYVDATGANIMFSLVAPGLTGFEQDGLANFYDARVGGGFLPPIPPAHCSEESCQGPLLGAPALALPGTAFAFSGSGNLVAAPAVKPAPKVLTRAQKLAAALKACRRKAKGKKRRASCERQARKRYAPLKARKASKGRG